MAHDPKDCYHLSLTAWKSPSQAKILGDVANYGFTHIRGDSYTISAMVQSCDMVSM